MAVTTTVEALPMASGIASAVMAVEWPFGFVGLALATVLIAILILALVLMVRGRRRRPTIVDASGKEAPRGLCARILAALRRALEIIDYLATRREWRYRQPWLLMLGEQAAGKSSLIASIAPTWRYPPPPRAADLRVRGAQWHFFRHGVVIDPDGSLPVAEPGSEEARRWAGLLTDLDALRPERPIDGIVLCVSARSLLHGKRSERTALAETINRQLVTIQTAMEFALPIYVAIVQCDGVPGFAAFWKSQAPGRRDELMGYSAAPEDEGRPPASWADVAFAVIGERLRELQVDTAAHSEQIENVDDFFLFPGRFKDLREPLSQWLETVFRATAWQRGHLFRGLYFTGSASADGAQDAGLRKDVDFVDALFATKVLREPALARPTRQGIWSRNRAIRSVQMAGVAALLTLVVGLGLAARSFEQQVDAIVAGVAALERAMPAGPGSAGCPEREDVYTMLVRVSRIDTRSRYWSIPLSWLDDRPTRRSAQVIGRTAIEQVLMPTLACRLQARAEALLGSADDLAPESPEAIELAARQAAFLQLIADVRALEDNLARYEVLARLGESLDERHLIETLDQLARYAFDAPLPQEVWRRGGVLDDAFHHIPDVPMPALPDDLHERLAARITNHGATLRSALSIEVGRGSSLLAALAGDRAPVLADTRRLAVWLAWVQQSWLGSTETRNPCADIAEAGRSDIDILVERYDFPISLRDTLRQFDDRQCHRPEMLELAKTRIEPYGPLFVPGEGGLVVAPAVAPELIGIPALVALPFMRLNPLRPFQCLGGDVIWQADAIAEAASYVEQYTAFIADLPSPTLPDGGRPLYDRLARQSLAHALDDSLRRAQQVAPDALRIGVEAIGRSDMRLARTSEELARGMQSLHAVLAAYLSYGFASGPAVRQCSRTFAADNLGAIDGLADGSRLYVPTAASGDDLMYELGSLPVTRDFLARQLARAQVLSGYAAPFVALLDATPGIDDTWRSTAQTAPFWRNTIDEIDRYIQGKEPAGQVGNLEAYFINPLADMTYADCAQELADYHSPAFGNDLFSERRRSLEAQVGLRCNDRLAAQAAEIYDALVARFERDLAGRYPFGPQDAPDASPAVVQAFFRDYARDRDRIAAALVDLGDRRWRPASRFVDQLNAVADFFAGNLDASTGTSPIDLGASFPAETARSVGGDQVLSWRLAIDDVQSVFPNGQRALSWYPGQAVALDLQWAERSTWRPVADPAAPGPNVRDAVAGFQAGGSWALLRFIDSHRRVNVDARHPDRILLGFEIPVQATHADADGRFARARSRVFMTLDLSGADPEGGGTRRLALPERFPRAAPDE